MELHANGHSFEGQFIATQTGKRTCSASGSIGAVADGPLPLELEVLPDSAPRVELVSPSADTLVAGDDRLPLRLTVTHDVGISRVELQSWKQASRGTQPTVVQSLATAQSTVWNGSVVLD